MATDVTSVTALINGVETVLSLNSETGLWGATTTAPATSSYHQSGGYYNVSLTAVKASGTTTTVDADDFDELQLVVQEKNAPTITILSPNTDAYLTSSTVNVNFSVTDDDSGMVAENVSLTVDGAGKSFTTVEDDGYTISGEASITGVTDGTHTIIVTATDNDGNTAESSVTFVVDTVAPSLDITSPAEGLITAETEVTVSGTTSETTSVPVTVTVSVNGGEATEVTVNDDGTFTTTVTLEDGENTITVTATDQAGQTTTVTRTVTSDSSLPTFVSVVIEPNPADAGKSVTLTVEVY